MEKPNQPNMFPRHEIFAQETYLNKSIFKEESLKSELIVLAAEYNTFKNFRLLIFLNAKTIGNVFGDNTLVIRDDGRTLLLSNTAIPVNINLIFDVINKSDSGLGSIEDRESDSYVFYNKLKNYNWYYVKIISYKKAFSSINAFSNLALLVIISLFFSSFFLSYYFSLKMYKPIRRLTDLIENPSTEMYGDALGNANNRKPDEIQQIYQYLMNININYESIEKRFAIMQDVFKELFYVKLIKEPEIDEGIIKELNLDPADFDNIAVISYTLNFKPEFYKFEQNNEKLGKINFSIKEMVDFVLKNMNVNSYSFQVNSNSFISILLLSGKNFNVQDFENKVLGILKNDSDILYVNFAVSRVYHGLHELKTAYNEALEYSEYCSIRMESQFATFEKVKNIKIQKIPKKLFTKIRSIIELIEFDNLEASFIELTEYLEEKNVPIIYIKSGLITIVNDLLGKAEIEGVNPEGIESIYKEIEVLRTKERCDEIINKICKLCKAALEQMNENTSGNSIVEDMAAYISKNYSEDISLDLFAEKYRMSPIYLSKLFKDCKGVNYMDYLNDVRMEKAKEFLLNTDIKIKDISVKIGYKDPNAFIKAFKKNFGVSPGKFRRINLVMEL